MFDRYIIYKWAIYTVAMLNDRSGRHRTGLLAEVFPSLASYFWHPTAAWSEHQLLRLTWNRWILTGKVDSN